MDAGSGEQTRVDALVVLAQRNVFAATWPGQNQAVRTLTNSGGETAMPLFSGRDVLDETAARFGWLNPDGSLSFRELPARDALRHALGRGVHFVVMDIGSDHAVEFAREEIEPLLQLQNQGGTGPFAAAGEPQAAIRDAVRRSTRPPPMAAGQDRPAGKSPVDIDLPFAGVNKAPGRAVSQPLAPTTARTVPQNMRQRPPSQPMMSAVRAPSVRPPSMGYAAAEVHMPSSEPPAAAQKTAAQKTAALEVAAALTSAARAAGDAEALKVAEEMARMLMSDAVASDAVSAPKDDSKAAAKRMAALFMGQAVPEDESADRESGEQERQPGEPPALPDTLLQAISHALRSFPEVEWACVQSDGSELPVIGLRVDPSFLNRVADITDAVFAAADKHGALLQVLLLNNTDMVKTARKHGKAFYPWKR